MSERVSRRTALATLAQAMAASGAWLGICNQLLANSLQDSTSTDRLKPLRLRYALPSCMYGTTELLEVLEQVGPTGSEGIDLWPMVHGNQREQLDEWGEERFRGELERLGISLSCLTQYKLGPFGLAEEMALAQRLGCSLIVTGAVGPKGLSGAALADAIEVFVKQMREPLDQAREHGVTIAIENHGGGLIDSEEAILRLCDATEGEPLGIALAPYHLPQESQGLAQLIRELDERMVMFYAWQHGAGCMQAQPLEQELLQLPGRGELDFAPLVEALAEIEYRGLTEIFMHPFPRGRAILDSTQAVTEQIVTCRDYLEGLWPTATR